MDKKVFKLFQDEDANQEGDNQQEKEMFISQQEIEEKIEQLIDRGQVEKLFKDEENEFFNICLKKLGLCERKGLDGQIMLYPVKSKERKLEKNELEDMMSRLYTVQKKHKADFRHINDRTIEQIESQSLTLNMKGKTQIKKQPSTNMNYSNISRKSLPKSQNSTEFLFF